MGCTATDAYLSCFGFDAKMSSHHYTVDQCVHAVIEPLNINLNRQIDYIHNSTGILLRLISTSDTHYKMYIVRGRRQVQICEFYLEQHSGLAYLSDPTFIIKFPDHRLRHNNTILYKLSSFKNLELIKANLWNKIAHIIIDNVSLLFNYRNISLLFHHTYHQDSISSQQATHAIQAPMSSNASNVLHYQAMQRSRAPIELGTDHGKHSPLVEQHLDHYIAYKQRWLNESYHNIEYVIQVLRKLLNLGDHGIIQAVGGKTSKFSNMSVLVNSILTKLDITMTSDYPSTLYYLIVYLFDRVKVIKNTLLQKMKEFQHSHDTSDMKKTNTLWEHSNQLKDMARQV